MIGFRDYLFETGAPAAFHIADMKDGVQTDFTMGSCALAHAEDCGNGIFWKYDKGLRKPHGDLLIL